MFNSNGTYSGYTYTRNNVKTHWWQRKTGYVKNAYTTKEDSGLMNSQALSQMRDPNDSEYIVHRVKNKTTFDGNSYGDSYVKEVIQTSPNTQEIHWKNGQITYKTRNIVTEGNKTTYTYTTSGKGWFGNTVNDKVVETYTKNSDGTTYYTNNGYSNGKVYHVESGTIQKDNTYRHDQNEWFDWKE